MSGRYGASRQERRRHARRHARVRRLTASSSAVLLAVASLGALDRLPLPDGLPGDEPTTDELAAPPVGTSTVLAKGAIARAEHTSVSRAAADRAGGTQSQVEVTLNAGANYKPPALNPLPADSGSGKRVVFDITSQQLWLVGGDGSVVRTYMVSGSRYDQLDAGVYNVFSASRHAVSWRGESTMEYMVRFFRSRNSNIGFHDIPESSTTGEQLQTLSELGTPLSDGCIRQDHKDAKALYEFAPVGTAVVVVRT